MIIIEDTILSEDIFKVKFCCDLAACKGACCVEGDAGAPLEEEEISILEDCIDEVKPYMVEEGRSIIEKQGVFDYDGDGEFVTPLVNDKECTFVYWENGTSFCAIEKAWSEGKIKFQKPISCHLYPIRLSKLHDSVAVNYHQWEICKPALKKGGDLGLPLYKFLKDPLIRKFGKEWYGYMEEAAKHLDKDGNIKKDEGS